MGGKLDERTAEMTGAAAAGWPAGFPPNMVVAGADSV